MKKKYEEAIKCDKCYYHNKKEFALTYGTCLRCGSVIDPKAKFKYDMNKKMRLWKGKLKG